MRLYFSLSLVLFTCIAHVSGVKEGGVLANVQKISIPLHPSVHPTFFMPGQQQFSNMSLTILN